MTSSADAPAPAVVPRLVRVLKRFRWGARRIPRRHWVGLARTLIARSAGAQRVALPAPGTVRRVVFVCHGNIMRSAFAHACWAARAEHERTALPPQANARASVASAGTDARLGRAAHPVAAAAAERIGVSLAQHAATPLETMPLAPGDLLVGFDCENEVQLHATAALHAGVSVLLLGDLEHQGTLDAEVRDPWGSSEANTALTFERIARLLDVLDARLRGRCTGNG